MREELTDLRPPLARALTRLLRPVDRAFLGIYGEGLDPLYQSGTVAVACLAAVLVSGVYLLIFYRISAPYESVAGLQADPWIGRWVRAFHRYASDACIVFVALHALKMFMGARTWGPRALAWISGVVLVGVLLFSGVSGLVMVWDVQAQVLACDTVRALDYLPILSEPLSRLFAENDAVPRSFFFMTLFLHVLVPLGGAALLWLHVSRVARPLFLPPRGLTVLLITSLGIASIMLPVPHLGPADLQTVPGRMEVDWFYAFWIPLSRAVGMWGAAAALLAAGLAVVTVPLWWRPRQAPPRSHVDERLCTGCTTCSLDCPYDAIRMVARGPEAGPRLSELVARVNPSLCVSCGICAASCAPMGVGPPGRSGRDQLREADAWAGAHPHPQDTVAVLACRFGPGDVDLDLDGFAVHVTDCSGTVHTSVVEALVRRGFGGVFILGCPTRDCSNREGPKWLAARIHDGREAELQARVDRRRVQVGSFSAAQRTEIVAAMQRFRASLPAPADVPSTPPQIEAPECASDRS